MSAYNAEKIVALC